MKREHRLLIIAIGIGLAGTTSGYALGGYATGGSQDAVSESRWWDSEAPTEGDGNDAPGTAAVVTPADGPEHYVCKGCGLTLAERRMRGDMPDYAVTDSDTVPDAFPPPPPIYQSAGRVEGQPMTLPDLGQPN